MSHYPEKLCLICMDRTGSNLISSRLHTHPDICFYNEVFHRQFIIFQDDRVNANPDLLARRDQRTDAFVSQLWRGGFEPEDTRNSLRAVGFKLFLNHNANALKYVINSDAKIIFLRRRNALSRFSSFKIATQTGEWKSSKSSEKKVRIPFHPSEFRAYYQNYLSLEMMFEMVTSRWNRPYFDIHYEDVVNVPSAWDNLVKYIGFSPEEFGESSLVKQNADDVLSRFTNPEVVQEFVAKLGRYEWLRE